MVAPKDESYSEKETALRRDATIKRMIAMPPKLHSEMKLGRTKSKAPRKASLKSPKRAKKPVK